MVKKVNDDATKKQEVRRPRSDFHSITSRSTHRNDNEKLWIQRRGDWRDRKQRCSPVWMMSGRSCASPSPHLFRKPAELMHAHSQQLFTRFAEEMQGHEEVALQARLKIMGALTSISVRLRLSPDRAVWIRRRIEDAHRHAATTASATQIRGESSGEDGGASSRGRSAGCAFVPRSSLAGGH